MFLVRMKMSPLLLKTLYYLRSCYQLTRHGDDEMWMTNDSPRERQKDGRWICHVMRRSWSRRLCFGVNWSEEIQESLLIVS